jgi:hypothetical protein
MSDDSASPSTSTVPPDSYRAISTAERAIHVAAFSLVGLVVLAAAIGLLGVRTSVVSTASDGYRLDVLRAVVTRAGLATPFRVEVTTQDGSALPDQVTLVVDADYLASFDFNGLQPTPTETFSRGNSTSWTFDIPPGQYSLRVDMDARLEPAVQWARGGSVELIIEGQNVASADFTTWVMP